MELDDTDRKIISLLQEDGRMSYSDIAEVVGKTEVTVRRRVRRLLREGIIKRFTVVLDPMKMGRRICAMIRVKAMMKQATLIAEKVRNYEEVDEAYFLDGACGLMLKVTVNDLGELRDFLEKRLGKVPGVGEVETCIVLETVKSPF
ncbi:MAG: Lrp/AsnC family transcriptional regulator [Candidatus Thorarchaeota archaeon]|nr:MAG: Lrp/AsnC family transcriptional regulator [Candidatus Thorarchaeota archaeon]